jgi:hypothetical protein
MIDEWGDMCFSMSMCLYFADVSTLTENDERSIGIKLSWSILRFCGGDFVGGFENFVFSRFRVCLYTILYLLYFMMVWYGAFRSLVYSGRQGEDAEYPFIFWMFLADTVW